MKKYFSKNNNRGARKQNVESYLELHTFPENWIEDSAQSQVVSIVVVPAAGDAQVGVGAALPEAAMKSVCPHHVQADGHQLAAVVGDLEQPPGELDAVRDVGGPLQADAGLEGGDDASGGPVRSGGRGHGGGGGPRRPPLLGDLLDAHLRVPGERRFAAVQLDVVQEVLRVPLVLSISGCACEVMKNFTDRRATSGIQSSYKVDSN